MGIFNSKSESTLIDYEKYCLDPNMNGKLIRQILTTDKVKEDEHLQGYILKKDKNHSYILLKFPSATLKCHVITRFDDIDIVLGHANENIDAYYSTRDITYNEIKKWCIRKCSRLYNIDSNNCTTFCNELDEFLKE